MADGTLIFDTKIDTAGFEKGVSSLKSDGQKAVSSVGNIMKGVLGASAVKMAGQALIGFGKDSIILASNLVEVQNVVDKTFGEGAAQINQFAKEASTGFGLTELQAKQFTGTLGAMVKSMGLSETQARDMAVDMTKLAGDVASFYNLDHQTAFEKIRSGLSGETEPLKQLGINMSVANLEAYRLSKGIATTYDKMTEAERVQLRYSYIMTQTADAQGDFTRTQDGLANQMRIFSNNIDTLAANIGSALLPMANAGITALNNLLSGVTSNGGNEPEIVKELKSAIEQTNNLQGAVDTARQDFARNVIKINTDYTEAQNLIDKLDELKAERGESGNIDLGEITLKAGSAGEEVENLQKALQSLGYTITDENGVFGASTAAAVTAFQESANIATDSIVGQQTKAALNAAIISQSSGELVEITQQLVALYPELAQYVGEDGVLSEEAQRLQEVTEGYKELAIAKAFVAKTEALGSAYAEGYVNLELQRQKTKQAESEAEKLQQERDAIYDALYGENGIGTLYDKFQNEYSPAQYAFEGGIGAFMADDPKRIYDAVNALNSYFEIFGAVPQKFFDIMQSQGVDMSTLIGADGLIDKDAVGDDVETLTDLYSAMETLAAYTGSEEVSKKEEQINAISEAVSLSNEAEAAAKTALDEINNEIEITKKAQESFEEELKSTSEEAGTDAGKNVTSGISDELSKDTKGKSAMDNYLDSLQREADKKPIRVSIVPGTAQTGTSHATGLYRVPYDNYYARLHAGERVLTAAEAKVYNKTETAAPAVVAEPRATQQQTIVVTVDGTELARAQVANNRAALNDYSRKVAQGRGHR